jgi:hypothetical protein
MFNYECPTAHAVGYYLSPLTRLKKFIASLSLLSSPSISSLVIASVSSLLDE